MNVTNDVANGNGGLQNNTSAMKASLGEAGGHLKQAAIDSGDAIKGATVAAGNELRIGTANLKADLADGALAGIAAAEQAGGMAREQMDVLMDKGRDLIDSASELVRERPLTSFGIAFATGYVIAKLTRGNGK